MLAFHRAEHSTLSDHGGHDIPELELSQNYNFFYDQLEKANLFLQAIIDTSSLLPATRRWNGSSSIRLAAAGSTQVFPTIS